MFILWAPWRFKYIENVNNKGECIFCSKPKEEPSSNNLVLYKSKFSFIIMNLFPYNTGHLMVAPYKHTSKIRPGIYIVAINVNGKTKGKVVFRIRPK